MGWGAAYAIAEEWSDWCDGPEEAYEILYGSGDDDHDDAIVAYYESRCPVCQKRFKGSRKNRPQAIVQHMKDVHKKRKHQAKIEAWMAEYDLDNMEIDHG